MENPDPTIFITILDHKAALVAQQAEFDAVIATHETKATEAEVKEAELSTLKAQNAEILGSLKSAEKAKANDKTTLLALKQSLELSLAPDAVRKATELRAQAAQLEAEAAALEAP